MYFIKSIFSLLWVVLLVLACKQDTPPTTSPFLIKEDIAPMQPSAADREWAEPDNIYEVNIRQYTPEGTFAAFAEHLPRLRDMGVDILWLMPIHPISTEKRKGSLGSYYAVSDYTGVNPEFGSPQDFRNLVSEVHELGMKIIIDWVPNHTGWDHVWIERHPEFFTQDEEGNIIDPIDPATGESWGWTDVADLNYDNAEMRDSMIQALLFWPETYDIDGYRVDVAHGVPVDFWNQVSTALFAAEPELFMLAEAEVPALRNEEAFVMDYGWDLHHIMNAVAKGEEPASKVIDWYKEDREKYDKGYHMLFVTNHDENSWGGTIQERMGDNGDAMAVLAFTLDGMPLIYSGQEAGLNKRLEFFEKDPIEWGEFSKADFYKTLLALKHKNKALHNGRAGAEPAFFASGPAETTLAYTRSKGGNTVIVLLNFGEEAQSMTLPAAVASGTYTNPFDKSTVDLSNQKDSELEVPAHGYQILVK